MSPSRAKRPFAGASADPSQRQITSFFPATAGADPSPSPTASRPPPLPASVQADLLSVGMRVRKSVPDGYKTAGPSVFKLWTDNRPATTAAAGPPRELLPFCGINRVGGLAFPPEADDDARVPDLDAVPALTLSQETVDDGAEPSRKRLLDDDDDDDDEGGGGDPTLATVYNGAGGVRPVATPRRPRAGKAVSSTGPGQENVVVGGGDFEEADFLVYGQAREMDLSG
ncbi:hypothetical protein CDD83_7651 [Cordyceps sp. RAO-2017]|nr:hypothetical protein CDD83_7651 [Cordyceps sp. RAO-2017]